MIVYNLTLVLVLHRAGRYEIDGYVYNATEEPKMLMTGKWNESMSYQPCDSEGEPLPGTELKEVGFFNISLVVFIFYSSHKCSPSFLDACILEFTFPVKNLA